MKPGKEMRLGAVLVLLLALAGYGAAPKVDHALQQGATFNLDGHKGVLRTLDTLPYVDSDYTRRFRFDSADNPRLQELRRRCQLDEVVAAGQDEFGRQILLLDWVNQRFPKFGRPTSQARGALEILRAIDEGHTFFCAHYAEVLVSAAASLGWVARGLALRRPDRLGEGATEHSVTEVWSNQYRKWVLFDPTFALYAEKGGVPLNAYELRQEWFYRGGQDLVFVIGKQRRRYRKADLPIFHRRFAGFGDLSVTPTLFHMYAFIGYVPNTDLMDARPDYGKMFIVQDGLCAGTRWHRRTVPANPAQDPYFPVGQAAVRLVPEGAHLRVEVRTLTPNLQSVLVRVDGGRWGPRGQAFRWELHQGSNRLEAKTVNRFGVEGPVSRAEVEVEAPAQGRGREQAENLVPTTRREKGQRTSLER